jgi:peptide/nickel transport system ATP-binding protein
MNPPKGCRFAARCRYATDECREEQPPLGGEVAGHLFACYHPVGEAEWSRTAKVVDHVGPRMPELVEADSTDAPVLLDVEHLVKDFPVTKGAVMQRRVGSVSAVADVNFTIRGGQTLGVVGESGCGKTTIGRLVVGLDKPTAGSINFEGRDLARSSGREYRKERQNIQLMFQDAYASLDPRMRAGAVLEEPLVVQGIGSRAERSKKVAEMLDHVGLPRTATERYPHEFSGGQRQRLGFARALILSPKLIVADEPVSALDVSIQSQILNMMTDLQRELGLTYLFISHDLAVVRYVSSQIGVMYLGKLVEIGAADDVYLTPAHPYTRGLLDSAPVADPEAEHAKVKAGITGELPSAIHPPTGCRFRTRCPLAEDICAEVEPPLRPFPGTGHLAACHFPLQNPLGADATTAEPASAP